MFTIYKKVTSPETSPLLGPAKSPDIKPTDPPILMQSPLWSPFHCVIVAVSVQRT